MSNPAYMWLTDENGSPMIGSSLVTGRIGAIELKSLTHNVNIPADNTTGAASGTHLETILLRYESITWKHCDGNIIYKDSWNHRVTA